MDDEFDTGSDLTEDITNDITDDIPDDVPDDIPDEIPEDVPDEITEEETEEITEEDEIIEDEEIPDDEEIPEDVEIPEDEEIPEGEPEINSISDYMNAHNYGKDDFATYSQDPQWRQLMRQEYPDYELPEMSQESASTQLSQYMSYHNYGADDYAEYSQDPIWRELHSTAYPDYELPPLSGGNELDELADLEDTGILDAESETSLEASTEYDEYTDSFFSKNKIARNYESYSIKDAENLSDVERNALRDYTSEDAECSYKNINRSLYDPEFKAANEEEEIMLENDVNVLTDCLDNKELPQSKLYRGTKTASDIFGDDVNTLTPEEIIEKYTGTEYVNPAFTSTSCSKDVARKFADGGLGGDSGLLTVNVPNGTKGMCLGDVSTFGGVEGEVLLQRGTVFRLDKILYNNSRYNITMTATGNLR
jgi:hypothetical protein